MKDLNAARPSEKSAETISALLPWVEQMMRAAKVIPNLRPIVEGVPAEHCPPAAIARDRRGAGTLR